MVDTVARQSDEQAQRRAAQQDIFPIQAIDYVEFYVGNALQAAHYYRLAWGYNIVAYRGPETGSRDRVSYVLEQGKIRLVMTSALTPEGDIARHVNLHGDGVKDIALRVPSVDTAYHSAVIRGAKGLMEPTTVEGQKGSIRRAEIATYGETVHSLVERQDYHGAWMPGFWAKDIKGRTTGLRAIDHIVGNVELGRMDEWVEFYRRIMGFDQITHFSDKQISTEYSALMSKVVSDGTGKIKFPINEPASGKRKSQVEEYLDFYRGPGAQHIALVTGDIVSSVEALAANGVPFLRTPNTYYEELPARIGDIDEDLEALQRNGILADRDEEGYLLQVFSKAVQDRPTVFYELIERHGARGFGEGNFKALFEALEREQEARGNL